MHQSHLLLFTFSWIYLLNVGKNLLQSCSNGTVDIDYHCCRVALLPLLGRKSKDSTTHSSCSMRGRGTSRRNEIEFYYVYKSKLQKSQVLSLLPLTAGCCYCCCWWSGDKIKLTVSSVLLLLHTGMEMVKSICFLVPTHTAFLDFCCEDKDGRKLALPFSFSLSSCCGTGGWGLGRIYHLESPSWELSAGWVFY